MGGIGEEGGRVNLDERGAASVPDALGRMRRLRRRVGEAGGAMRWPERICSGAATVWSWLEGTET